MQMLFPTASGGRAISLGGVVCLVALLMVQTAVSSARAEYGVDVQRVS